MHPITCTNLHRRSCTAMAAQDCNSTHRLAARDRLAAYPARPECAIQPSPRVATLISFALLHHLFSRLPPLLACKRPSASVVHSCPPSPIPKAAHGYSARSGRRNAACSSRLCRAAWPSSRVEQLAAFVQRAALATGSGCGGQPIGAQQAAAAGAATAGAADAPAAAATVPHAGGARLCCCHHRRQ